jgi:hypothetical protein
MIMPVWVIMRWANFWERRIQWDARNESFNTGLLAALIIGTLQSLNAEDIVILKVQQVYVKEVEVGKIQTDYASTTSKICRN